MAVIPENTSLLQIAETSRGGFRACEVVLRLLHVARQANARGMRIIVRGMLKRFSGNRASFDRADPFYAQLSQHTRGLSPTSQFSPLGGAGGNALTYGVEMSTRP
jgi:hypothetical protein